MKLLLLFPAIFALAVGVREVLVRFVVRQFIVRALGGDDNIVVFVFFISVVVIVLAIVVRDGDRCIIFGNLKHREFRRERLELTKTYLLMLASITSIACHELFDWSAHGRGLLNSINTLWHSGSLRWGRLLRGLCHRRLNILVSLLFLVLEKGANGKSEVAVGCAVRSGDGGVTADRAGFGEAAGA